MSEDMRDMTEREEEDWRVNLFDPMEYGASPEEIKSWNKFLDAFDENEAFRPAALFIVRELKRRETKLERIAELLGDSPAYLAEDIKKIIEGK